MTTKEEIRNEFPALKKIHNGQPVIFADNASTTLKPARVIKAVSYFYTDLSSNVHRGVNALTQETETIFENTRHTIAEFINALPEEIIFVKNATEAINLAAHCANLRDQDEVICSITEHHSNLLPWFSRYQVRTIIAAEGTPKLEDYEKNLSRSTKLITVSHVSNITGIKYPIEEIINLARNNGLFSLIDASQSISHCPLDVKKLDCDFLVFSGHKIFGPSGVGVLYMKKEIQEKALPLQFGGGMVSEVWNLGYELTKGPRKFEAGTPNIEGVMGLGEAIRFVIDLGWENIQAISHSLSVRLYQSLLGNSKIKIFPGNCSSVPSVPIISFTIEGPPQAEIAKILSNRYGIMARFGAHCAEPYLRQFGVSGLTRISLQLYNTLEEVDYISRSIRTISEMELI
jgi:cysteine desulfurase/selenocysteine lyase